MKVAIGQRPYNGPWGGGNRFVAALSKALGERGHDVVYELSSNDIDVIVITDPRVRLPNVSIGAGAILRYLTFRNPNAIVVHRVNECDERKNEASINAKLVRSNYVADATVFVGEWLSRLPVWRKNLRQPWFTIRNGSDRRLFHRDGFEPWNGTGPLKFVTHHWGYHPMKGADIYTMLDELMGTKRWRGRLSFTYIGNLPKTVYFKNATHIPPLDGEPLADALRGHHAYVTGSINEPGGNHQNEGALCGLPLLYRDSGCMPEYCSGFGVAFSGRDDFEAGLIRFIERYASLVEKMPSYPWTAERMTSEWIARLEQLVGDRDAIVRDRRLWRSPLRAAMTQILL